jgi:hypothetical protein
VVPSAATEDDKSRLDSLCQIFGIGLVYFDNATPKEPKFEIRVRPSKNDPDSFYVNENARKIEDDLFG